MKKTAIAVMTMTAFLMFGCASGRIQKVENRLENGLNYMDAKLNIVEDKVDLLLKAAEKTEATEVVEAEVVETEVVEAEATEPTEVMAEVTEEVAEITKATKKATEMVTEVIEKIEAAEPVEETEVAETTEVAAEVTEVAEVETTEVPEETTKTILNDRVEKLERWAENVSRWANKLNHRVDAHDSQFSELRRRLAEVEDEIQPVYLWTQPFPSGKPKKPEEKEKPQLAAEIQPGLDNLAIEILAGRVALERDVVGHADPRGKKKDNEELSERRAQASIDYLVEKLGPDLAVKWLPAEKWKDYFTAVAGGPTKRYGNFKFNRRVRFERQTNL